MDAPGFLPHARLDALFDALRAAGYRVVGPRVQEGAIMFGELAVAAELPYGVVDRQAPGAYRLEGGDARRAFAWANGPQALKPLLFAPRETLWRSERAADGAMRFENHAPDLPRTAVIGVRACDLAALTLQDQHFLHCSYPDPYYHARREQLFIVAVHCSHPATTCFCVSTGDGPQASSGYDIALGELDEGFVATSGSERGAAVLAVLSLPAATEEQLARLQAGLNLARQQQSRALPRRDLQASLFANLEHPRWDEVAERCLACGNCTAVCPTCFCHSENDVPSLDGSSSEHVRQWDSCFTQGHSYIHGLTIRPDTRLRYRQWLTHKLGSWHEQYGRSGCVGCGRCITWCPTGIDLTEETAAICGEGGA